MSRFLGVLFAALVLWGVPASSVCAQVGGSLTSSTPFPVSIVSPGGALAVDVNPAAISDLRSWALRLEHVRGSADTVQPDRRTGGYLAIPTRFRLGLGAGLESLRARQSLTSPSYRTLSWAASLWSSPAWSLGASWRIRFPERAGDSAHTAELALSFKPSPTLGFTLLGRNLAIEPARIGGLELARLGLFAAQLRPLADDRLWLELAAGVRDGGDLALRAALGLAVPGVGALALSGERTELAGYMKQVRLWADTQFAAAVKTGIAGDFKTATKMVTAVKNTLRGEPEGKDAELGLKALKALPKLTDEDAKLAAAEPYKGTRWESLFTGEVEEESEIEVN